MRLRSRDTRLKNKHRSTGPVPHLVDDVEEPGDVFLVLAAGVVLLRPQPPAVTAPPRPLLLARAARVDARARRQPAAGQVGGDPCEGARPSGRNTEGNRLGGVSLPIRMVPATHLPLKDLQVLDECKRCEDLLKQTLAPIS